MIREALREALKDTNRNYVTKSINNKMKLHSDFIRDVQKQFGYEVTDMGVTSFEKDFILLMLRSPYKNILISILLKTSPNIIPKEFNFLDVKGYVKYNSALYSFQDNSPSFETYKAFPRNIKSAKKLIKFIEKKAKRRDEIVDEAQSLLSNLEQVIGEYETESVRGFDIVDMYKIGEYAFPSFFDEENDNYDFTSEEFFMEDLEYDFKKVGYDGTVKYAEYSKSGTLVYIETPGWDMNAIYDDLYGEFDYYAPDGMDDLSENVLLEMISYLSTYTDPIKDYKKFDKIVQKMDKILIERTNGKRTGSMSNGASVFSK